MNSFLSPFNQTLFPENYDYVIISSDDEPDDAVAKYFLTRALQKYPNIQVLWITGEGKVSKLGLLRDQLSALGVQYTIVQGQFSDRNYPNDMLTAFSNISAQNQLTASMLVEQNDNSKEAVMELRSFLSKSQNPLFVMLKPCWELFDIPSDLLAKLTMAVYGSFNFRCLCEKQERSKVAAFFNDSFKRVVLYETFFVMGEDNSINSINAPRFYELIRQKASAGDRYFTGVNNSVQIWNEHIVKSQLSNVQKVSKNMFDSWDEETRQITTAGGQNDMDQVWKKRKANVDKILQGGAKIVNSIIVARGQQMVFADFGLAALMLAENYILTPQESVVQCNIAFDEGRGNTLVKRDTQGKVFVLKNINRAELIAACEKAIEQ